MYRIIVNELKQRVLSAELETSRLICALNDNSFYLIFNLLYHPNKRKKFGLYMALLPCCFKWDLLF